MAYDLPVKTSQLQSSDQNTIKELIRIYQEAYKTDKSIQLKYIMPQLIERMSETIALRVKQPGCEFIVATTEDSSQIVGWLALAFKREQHQQLSEEHVLFTQYVLLPDIVAKGKNEGVGMDEMKATAHKLLGDFKDAREKRLPGRHCILSALVVDPEYQKRGVGSALLAKAINVSEAFSFPIWVQAPEIHQNFFKNHLFEVDGEYRLDLSELVSTPDDNGKGKGKGKAESTLGIYAWKFMVRREPLQPAVRAFRSSVVFAEQEVGQFQEDARFAEQEADKWKEEVLYRKKKERARISKASAEQKASPRPTDSLLQGNTQAASGEGLVARNDADEGPSTPLLAQANSRSDLGALANERAAKEVMYS